ncbi:hypothetical protein F4779DRAFT_523787 [Xylariaceae sp. FL0662B]|nr:hypothetical protein F4779DRAFT_523787 [Xylariaceae sp. FL0662B]
MSDVVFSRFAFFPPEIRRYIYLLATPPRVVEIQERAEDYHDFRDRFKRDWPQLRLSPSIAYFARHWRALLGRALRPPRQQRLEAYGFTNSKPPYQPWAPSNATPEIPVFGLVENIPLAWQLLRESYLFSTAPIPPLLHTCMESRSVLISDGYQLAFRSRTNGPRTWFHFGKDTLYLHDHEEWELEYCTHFDFLCPVAYYMGRFDPSDMRKVKRVALIEPVFPYRLPAPLASVTEILRLMPAIEELMAVEWDPCDFEEPGIFNPFRDHGEASTTREPLQAVPAQVIDHLLCPVFNAGQFMHYLTESMRREHELRSYAKDNWGSADGFYEHFSRQAEKALDEKKQNIMARDSSAVPWNIPKITVQHICKPSSAQLLFRERRKVWENWLRLKKTVTKMAVRPGVDRELSPFSAQWQDDWEALHEAETSEGERERERETPPGRGHRCMVCDGRRGRRWWVTEAAFPAPACR